MFHSAAGWPIDDTDTDQIHGSGNAESIKAIILMPEMQRNLR